MYRRSGCITADIASQHRDLFLYDSQTDIVGLHHYVQLLDSAGQVAEGSGENVFVVKAGRIRTPPAHAGILKGVTRDAVIEVARSAGYDVQEEVLNRYDVYTAEEAFFTGTAAEVIGIRELDGRMVGAGRRGPVTADLAERYRALTRG